jgi:hypothetical protein
MCKQCANKNLLIIYLICVRQMYQNFSIWCNHYSNISFPKEKKKKESTSIEVMMNENGGSIPTGSEEWTLHSLPFILMPYYY